MKVIAREREMMVIVKMYQMNFFVIFYGVSKGAMSQYKFNALFYFTG
jgi:hypothetical protein